MQLPDYVISSYIYVGQPRLVLIDGPLVLQDEKNQLKCVVFFNGLIKENNMCGVEFIANTKSKKSVVEGLIYKYQKSKVDKYISKGKSVKIEKLADLFDIDYKLERINGTAIDSYEIEEIPQSDWINLQMIDPIPAELGLPSDIRFREDLIWLKRGEKGKGKVWKGMMNA